jgi:hypothetical protein
LNLRGNFGLELLSNTGTFETFGEGISAFFVTQDSFITFGGIVTLLSLFGG